MNRKGNATIFVLVMGVVMGIGVAVSSTFFQVKTGQLMTELNNREGMQASELAALNARANQTETAEETFVLPSGQNSADWGMRRYKPGSVKSRRNESEYCGVSSVGQTNSTVCVRDVTSENQQGCKLRSSGNRISFEKYPNGSVPSEGDAISDQFQSKHGVTICMWRQDNSMEGHGGRRADRCAMDLQGNTLRPRIVTVGAPKAAFTGYADLEDTLVPGMHTEKNFLADPYGGYDGGYLGILITYENPVAEAAGVVLNMNTDPGNVSYNITAVPPSGIINSSNSPANWSHKILEDFRGTIFTYTKATHGGKPGILRPPGSVVKYGFKHATADIKSILIRGLGTVAAVDNITGSKCPTEETESVQ